MAEEATEVTTEAGTETPNAETVVDWKKRYEDLRPQYDRIQNQYNQYEDPQFKEQKFKEWAADFGYEIDEGTETEVYDDPSEALRAEIAAQRQEFQQFKQELTQSQQVQIAESFADRELDKLGVQDERVQEWIKTRATAMPAIQYEGHIVPDVQAAYDDYQELMNAEKERWRQSKQTTHVQPGGQENTGVQNWSDDPVERAQQRQAYMIEQANLRAQAQQG